MHSSSGFKHALKEVLADPAVQARLQDTKAGEEVRSLEQFYKMLKNEPAKAFYGPKHVARAVEAEVRICSLIRGSCLLPPPPASTPCLLQAVEVLLICDKLFRAREVADRRRYVELVDRVREVGGEVRIFSSLHVSGEQLEQLSGLCAILRFSGLKHGKPAHMHTCSGSRWRSWRTRMTTPTLTDSCHPISRRLLTTRSLESVIPASPAGPVIAEPCPSV